MTNRMFLSPEEVIELTGRQRPRSQIEALRTMGIEHRPRPDGTPAVMRRHVEAVFAAHPDGRVTSPAEPNWDAVVTDIR